MEEGEAESFRAVERRVRWVERVVVLDETGSTNDDALRLGAEGAPHGTVVVADAQTAGRGRLGRSWWSTPGTTLTASVVMRPDAPVERWTLIPLACGVAVAGAVRRTTELPAALKWPNDVVVGDRKLAGILVEARPPGFVVAGIGINLSGDIPDELAGIATTVAMESAAVPERAALLAEILGELDERAGDPELVRRYRALCTTIGREVRIERSGADPVAGLAEDVDETGALVVATARDRVAVSAGDVVHLRPVGDDHP